MHLPVVLCNIAVRSELLRRLISRGQRSWVAGRFPSLQEYGFAC